MKVIISYIILNSLRNKLFVGLISALILSLFLSVFLGDTNLIEEKKSAIAIFAGCTRILLVIGMVIFVCLNIGRFFDNKEIDFLLSKSISREKFILSILLGYLTISTILSLLAGLTAVFFLDSGYLNSLIWFTSLLFEMILVSAFALLCSLILANSLLAIFASIGFYILSRLMALFTLGIELPWNSTLSLQSLPENILKLLSVIFPRLDLFTQSIWLSDGSYNSPEILLIATQTVIFLVLIIFMSFQDISKKEF